MGLGGIVKKEIASAISAVDFEFVRFVDCAICMKCYSAPLTWLNMWVRNSIAVIENKISVQLSIKFTSFEFMAAD